MGGSDKLIMAVKRDLLFGDEYFQGFRLQNEVDYESRILSNFEYMRRSVVEADPTYKQPVAYSMVVNPNLKQVFVYQRSALDERYSEKRLQGKWSWRIGGHIEKIDAVKGNPIYVSMLRELGEEIELVDIPDLKVLGYINSDADDVGKVHFGILYVVETGAKIVKSKDPEIDDGSLRAIEELEVICFLSEFAVEGWSRIALDPLKSYLKNRDQ